MAKEAEMAEEIMDQEEGQEGQQGQEANETVIGTPEEEGVVDEAKLPFPRATVVNMMRKYLTQGKQIKGQVKDEMNIWLGKIVERISTKLNGYPYSYVDGAMLREAVEPYENLQDIEKEKERIIKQLESIKAACDVLILEVDRKFVK
ncbi:Uncharacterised protein [uncultured archaeon]|nr:Uncharacterised protein [uncultured archaeon]